jgi:RNA polymerase-associated protein
MVLYSDSTCPESHCVRLVLAEKGIHIDLQLVDSNNKPKSLLALNPYYDEILTLVDHDLVLYEVQIITEYLDERFLHPPLMPADPVARAHNRLCRYRIQRDLYSHVRMLQHSNEKKISCARKQIRENLIAIAPIFTQKNYFMSDEYSLMDCYLVPLLWRLPTFQIELPPQTQPLLDYAHRLFDRDTFKNSLTNSERGMQA